MERRAGGIWVSGRIVFFVVFFSFCDESSRLREDVSHVARGGKCQHSVTYIRCCSASLRKASHRAGLDLHTQPGREAERGKQRPVPPLYHCVGLLEMVIGGG